MNARSDTKILLREAARLASQGAVERAAGLFNEAAQKEAGNLGVLLEAAKGLETVNRFGEAHDVYMAALAEASDNYIVHSRLAALYVAMEEIPSALKHFEEALRLNPGNADIMFNYALAHQAKGDIDTALDLFRRALDAGADRRLVFGSLAAIYEQTNRLEELKNLLDMALGEFPEDAYLNFVAAKTERRAGNLKKALEFLDRVKRSDEFDAVEMTFYFERGRIQDQLGRPDRAYQDFLTGNKFCLDHNRRFEADKEVSRSQISTYRNFDYSGWHNVNAPPIEDEERTPIFLVGFPRSGTTLLQQILDGHPDLEVLEEMPHIAAIAFKVMARTGSFPSGIPAVPTGMWAAVQRDYLLASPGFRKKGPDTRLVEKLPLNIVHVPLILKVFPRAKFIVALRHPCDCTLSCFMQNFSINNAMLNFTNLDDSTKLYDEVFSLWFKYRDELKPDFHYIRYEDVLDDLEGEAKKLISFVGLPWDENVLEYRKQALAKKHIGTPSYHQVVKPIYTDAKNRWRRYKRYLEPYLGRLEPYCKEFGYDL